MLGVVSAIRRALSEVKNIDISDRTSPCSLLEVSPAYARLLAGLAVANWGPEGALLGVWA